MALTSQQEEAIGSIRQASRELAEYDIEGKDLTRVRAWGEHNISEARPTFDQVQRLVAVLADSEFTLTPAPDLQQLLSHLKQMQQQFDKLADASMEVLFAKNNDRPDRVRKQYLDELTGVYRQLYGSARQALAFEGYAEVVSGRQQFATDLSAAIERDVAAIRSAKDEAEAARHAAKQAAAKVGVQEQAKDFADLKDIHSAAAWKWLIATGVLGVGWAVLAGLLAPDIADAGSDVPIQRAIAAASFRIVVLSVALYAVIWCARIYRHHKHNELVNLHRATALRTFRAFVESAKDDDTREAVLLQTTRAIFSPQSTGFGAEAETQSPTTSVIEVVRSVAGTSRGHGRGEGGQPPL